MIYDLLSQPFAFDKGKSIENKEHRYLPSTKAEGKAFKCASEGSLILKNKKPLLRQ